MYPVLCKIGPFTVYSYGFMLAVAVVVCSWLLKRDAAVAGIKAETVYDLVFWVVLSGIVGARIFFIVLNREFFWQNPGDIIMVQNGGLSWQGSLIAGSLVCAAYLWKKKLPFFSTLDLLAPYAALGQSIGRIGCFLNGCCYGRPAAWGIYFPAHQDRLHPTQIYDTVGLLIIFFILKAFQKKSRTDGDVFALYLILASVERFINEFFRADHTPLRGGLSIFQIVSLGVFCAGLTMHFYVKRRQVKF